MTALASQHQAFNPGALDGGGKRDSNDSLPDKRKPALIGPYIPPPGGAILLYFPAAHQSIIRTGHRICGASHALRANMRHRDDVGVFRGRIRIAVPAQERRHPDLPRLCCGAAISAFFIDRRPRPAC